MYLYYFRGKNSNKRFLKTVKPPAETVSLGDSLYLILMFIPEQTYRRST